MEAELTDAMDDGSTAGSNTSSSSSIPVQAFEGLSPVQRAHEWFVSSGAAKLQEHSVRTYAELRAAGFDDENGIIDPLSLEHINMDIPRTATVHRCGLRLDFVTWLDMSARNIVLKQYCPPTLCSFDVDASSLLTALRSWTVPIEHQLNWPVI